MHEELVRIGRFLSHDELPLFPGECQGFFPVHPDDRCRLQLQLVFLGNKPVANNMIDMRMGVK